MVSVLPGKVAAQVIDHQLGSLLIRSRAQGGGMAWTFQDGQVITKGGKVAKVVEFGDQA